MTETLAGKVAIVTGASSGIGAEMARALGSAGCRVALAARRADHLDAMAAELGENALAVPTDVSDRTGVDALVEAAIDRFGRIDIAYANAAVYEPRPFADIEPDVIDRLLAVNVAGVMHLAHAVLPHFRAQRSGDILLVGSIAGAVRLPGEAIYSPTKHAVHAFADILRRQVLADGIRVGVIAPGTVATELWGLADEDAIRARVAEGDAIYAEDVVRASLFMLTQPPHVTIRDLVILPQGQDI